MGATITIRGSHGELIADVATGLIVDARHDSPPGEGYQDIARFEPASLAREGATHGETDILAVGYWTAAGDYVEPLTMRRVECRAYGWDFDDWTPLRLLPAPDDVPAPAADLSPVTACSFTYRYGHGGAVDVPAGVRVAPIAGEPGTFWVDDLSWCSAWDRFDAEHYGIRVPAADVAWVL